MADYLEKISEAEVRARALEEQLADPELAQKPSEYQRLGKQLALERPLLEAGARYRATLSELGGAREMLADDDPGIAEMARSDVERLVADRDQIEQDLRQLLVPIDPNDVRNAILEIRAGTGGDEAALFAGDLFRMYHRHADRVGWQIVAEATEVRMRDKGMLTAAGCFDLFFSHRLPSGIIWIER